MNGDGVPARYSVMLNPDFAQFIAALNARGIFPTTEQRVALYDAEATA